MDWGYVFTTILRTAILNSNRMLDLENGAFGASERATVFRLAA
jgi:hypothetical protein